MSNWETEEMYSIILNDENLYNNAIKADSASDIKLMMENFTLSNQFIEDIDWYQVFDDLAGMK